MRRSDKREPQTLLWQAGARRCRMGIMILTLRPSTDLRGSLCGMRLSGRRRYKQGYDAIWLVAACSTFFLTQSDRQNKLPFCISIGIRHGRRLCICRKTHFKSNANIPAKKTSSSLFCNPFSSICPVSLIPITAARYPVHDEWPLISRRLLCTWK